MWKWLCRLFEPATYLCTCLTCGAAYKSGNFLSYRCSACWNEMERRATNPTAEELADQARRRARRLGA